jgi:putative ABC transport system permease protein
MSAFNRLIGGIRSMLHRDRVERDLDNELRAFLDASIDAKLAAGMSRADAERAARLELGSPAAAKDWTRDVGWESRVESVWQDVRYAIRLMRRSRAFSVTALISIALGTGTAIVMYSVLYGTLLRPLPVHDEQSLAVLYAVDNVRSDGPVSYPRLVAWRDSAVFAALAGLTPTTFDIAIDGFAERTASQGVTADFFRTVGVVPTRGRALDLADARSDGPTTPAVISHRLWTRLFAADESVLGRDISAGGSRTLTIVGVAPPGFEFWRRETHIWVPMESVVSAKVLQSDGYRLFTPIARLRPEVDRPLTAERLAATSRAFEEAPTERGRPSETVRIVSLRDDVVPQAVEYGIYGLLLGVGLTWIVVCANVANLLLGRGAHRASELSVRLALGAHRSRIFRQLLVESVVLAVPGGAAGLLLAFWGVRLLTKFGPAGLPGNDAILVDVPVFLAAVVLIIVTAVGCGALPAVRLSRTPLRDRMAAQSAPRRLSPLLLGAQFAIAAVVLIGALLAVKSVRQMQRVDLGFDPEQILTVRFQFLGPGLADPDGSKQTALQRVILERLESLPGVESATLTGMLFRPAHQIRWSIGLDDGRRFRNGEPDDRPFTPRPHAIGPAYFQIHGVLMLEGDEFTSGDGRDSRRVVVVNKTMAEMLWPGESAIGRRLNFGAWSPRRGYDEPWHEVVGVAADMRYGGVDEPVLPEVYQAVSQTPLRAGGYAVLKTLVPPQTLSASVREELRAVDPAIVVHPPQSLDAIVAESTALTRYSSTLLVLCAAITVMLSTFGVYSLLTYAVSSMRRELGIRLALGASVPRLIGDVLLPAVAIIVPGVLIGLALGAALAPALSSVIFGVSPRDPAVFAAAGVMIAAVGIASGWTAARRAARVDPLVALRAE